MKTSQPAASVYRPGRHLEIPDDPIHDPYYDREKLSEPAVCRDCGAVCHQGRWQWSAPPSHAHQARCPACWRIHENAPAGYVSIEGQFALDHRDEVLSLARHLETREKAEHPMQRIMSIEDQEGQFVITTTDIHLARAIGVALERAYKGELDFHYNKDEYLLRLRWRR